MDPHNNNNNRIIQPLPDETIEARYQLVLKNNVIKSPSFTTDPVKDEHGKTIKVEMYDTYTQSIISPDNILSSAKVRLMVLDAELWGNKTKNLSRSYFDQSVLRARETVGPILKGCSLTIQLENGFGKFQNIYFNDNSSWTRSGFQLAVMVVGEGEGEGEEGYLNGVRVLEGLSKPFRVKDRHVKAAQKPDKLKLTDNVQRIRTVGKDRASNLQKENIETVEHFLWWHYNQQPELRKILDIKSESDKRWRSMIDHTMTCANEFHAKYNAIKESMSNSENTSQPQQVVFHPMERNMSLSTNGGHLIVGSGSSDPNPCENHTIEGHIPTIYRPFTALCHFSSMIVLNRHISTASGEHIADTQHPLYPDTIASVHPMGSNMSFCTNGGPLVVGSGPSESIPGDMPIYVQFSAICDISSMVILNEHISTASGEHIAQTQHPFYPETNALVHTMERNMSLYVNDGPRVIGSGSSDPNPHERDIIEGVAYPYCPYENPGLSQPEIPDNQVPIEDFPVEDLPIEDLPIEDFLREDLPIEGFPIEGFPIEDLRPIKKRKMKSLLRSVTFAMTVVIRKRARIVPPVNQWNSTSYLNSIGMSC